VLRTAGRKISVSLEDAFWNALREIAASKNTSRPELVVMIDKKRSHPNLSSAIPPVRSRLLSRPSSSPMTLGNMRDPGVQNLIAFCLNRSPAKSGAKASQDNHARP
jgi:predicted DNA-binding ribbon-helix-helix protein